MQLQALERHLKGFAKAVAVLQLQSWAVSASRPYRCVMDVSPYMFKWLIRPCRECCTSYTAGEAHTVHNPPGDMF